VYFSIGLILGSTINMLLVEAGMIVFPAPIGLDLSTEWLEISDEYDVI
jgi:hypothetical protein